MNSRLKNFGPTFGFTLTAATLFMAGCSSDNTTAAGAPDGGAEASVPALSYVLGPEAHVVPGSAPSVGEGTEAKPFATIYEALSAIAASPAWSGAIVMHPGRHELPTDIVTPLTADVRIMAGTTLAYGPGVSFHAQRDVKAVGTAESPILMTWLVPGQHWCSFTDFNPESKENVFEYVTFEHGYESQFNGLSIRGALGLYYAAARISHCTFLENEGDDGLTINKSDSLVEYSKFIRNAYDAIDDGASHAEIRFSYFDGNGNDSVDLGEKTLAYVHDNVMVNGGDKGVSMGEATGEARIEHNLIVNCNIGVAFKDGASGIVTNNTFYSNKVGVASYEAVAGLGAGKGTFKNNIVWGSTVADLDLDPTSQTAFSYDCIQQLINPNTGAGIPAAATGLGILSPGNGCDDPMFANPTLDPSTWDFHLRSAGGHWDPKTATFVPDTTTSPAIDKGDPTTDATKEPPPNGGRVNLGVYGGTTEASKSLQ